MIWFQLANKYIMKLKDYGLCVKQCIIQHVHMPSMCESASQLQAHTDADDKNDDF